MNSLALEVIQGLPRVPLGHFPTPIEEITGFSRALGVRTLVKREDLSGLAFGGNKVRKLEFELGQPDALAADVLITIGGAQSNHARETAASGARLGKRVALVVTADPPRSEPRGNQLISRLLGADLHFVGKCSSNDPAVQEKIEEIRAGVEVEDLRAYVIPLGAATWLGVSAWALGILEALDQASAMDLSVDAVFVAAGTGSTAAGLALGAAIAGVPVEVWAVSIMHGAEHLKTLVSDLVTETAEAIGFPLLTAEAVRLVNVDESALGDGYGLPTLEGREALHQFASVAGLIGDLTYTSKALACMQRVVSGFSSRSTVLVIHTGGAPELFSREAQIVLE